MNNVLFYNILRFVALFLLQVFVMDQINFLGYINPIVYILFILFYPISDNRSSLLLLSFVMGIMIDTFHDTGGAHAAASVTLAFCRPFILRLAYGQGYLVKNLKVVHSGIDRFLLYLAISVLIHHLCYYLLVIFNIHNILQVFKLTFSTGIASVFMGAVLFVLFIKSQRKS